jgi:uncharacterized protein DUF6644
MLAYDPSTNPLNNNEWSFPLMEIIHIVGFAFSIGTVAIVDLRLLGLALPKQSPAQLLKDMAPWTLIGIAVMLMSGPIIFSSDPVMYLYNGSFQFKMAALLAAIIFNYTIHRKVAMADVSSSDAASSMATSSNATPGLSKLVAVISLTLWTSVVFAGLFIAFV